MRRETERGRKRAKRRVKRGGGGGRGWGKRERKGEGGEGGAGHLLGQLQGLRMRSQWPWKHVDTVKSTQAAGLTSRKSLLSLTQHRCPDLGMTDIQAGSFLVVQGRPLCCRMSVPGCQ